MYGDGRGLSMAKGLLKLGYNVNMTCLMNLNQFILACEIGATYASFFYNRMIDYSQKNSELIMQEIVTCRKIIDDQKYNTKIICGSIRKQEDVIDCLANGAHIVTVTPKVLEQMPFHEKTEETIFEFDKAWQEWRRK